VSRTDPTPASAECLKILEPQPPGTLGVCNWIVQELHYHTFYHMFGVNQENHERPQSEQPMTRLRFKTGISQIPIRNVNTTPFGTKRKNKEHIKQNKRALYSINCSFAMYMSVHNGNASVTGLKLADSSRTSCFF